MTSIHLKYLAVTPVDLEWGLAVNSVGRQEIAAGAFYPPSNHPTRYLFSTGKGRILSEYQLLYITDGRGTFSCDTLGREKKIPVEAGNMILLFPGEWHNYKPLEETGWTEYWIGFNGPEMDNLVKKGFFSRTRPLLDVSFHDELTEMYSRAIEIAENQQSGFQQALSGKGYYDADRCVVITNSHFTPAAVMLAEFTDNGTQLLLGVDIGGFGTLIASLASLISFQLYRKDEKAQTGRYFALFSVINFALFGLLLGVQFLIS